jgi:hypothetical protein
MCITPDAWILLVCSQQQYVLDSGFSSEKPRAAEDQATFQLTSSKSNSGLRPECCAVAGAAMDETTKLILVESTFLFSLVWSCGCTGDAESRKKFDTFFR